MNLFKIRKDEKLDKHIKFPEQLYERLAKSAAENDVSFNRLVVECCAFALDAMEEKSPA